MTSFAFTQDAADENIKQIPTDLYHQLSNLRTEQRDEYLWKPCMHRCALARCRFTADRDTELVMTPPMMSSNFYAKSWIGYQFIVSKFSHSLTTTTLKKQTTVLDYTDYIWYDEETARPKTEDFKTTHSKHSICNPWLQAYILKLNICISDTFMARIERIHLCYFSITWNFYSAIYSCTENETKKNKLFNNLLFFKSRTIFSYHKRASLKGTIYKLFIVLPHRVSTKTT